MEGNIRLMPKVSVIIPTYNRAGYIIETVDSVRNQSFQDYEIIIIDDGSKDNTRETLSDYIEENTIRYFFQENRGESAARNRGISEADGEYIAFLDSDDLFLPPKLEKQVAYLDLNQTVGLVHCWYSKFNNEDENLGRRNTSRFSGWIYPDMLLIWHVLMSPSCVMARSKIFAEVGGFDVDQYWGADLDMWRRIARYHPFGVIPEILTKVRVHEGNLSAKKIESLQWFEKYLSKAFMDDSKLGRSFKNRAMANMYTNVAHNLLGEITPGMPSKTRELILQAIHYWPFSLGAYLGFLASFFPTNMRLFLLEKFRSWRNPIDIEY